MSRILGMSPESFARATAGLTLEETGVFARLAALCLSAQKTGAVVMTLATIGVEPVKAWEVVTSLALRGVIVARVCWGDADVAIDDEMRWTDIAPRLNTVVSVELPACVEEWSRDEKRREAGRERVRKCRAAAMPKNDASGETVSPCNAENSVTKAENSVTKAENGVTVTPCNTDAAKVLSNAPARAGASGRALAGARTEDCISCSISIPPVSPLKGGGSSSSFVKNVPVTPKNGAAEAKKPAAKKTARKKCGRVPENTPLMIRIGGWFGRRASTLWSVDEAERLEAAAPTEDEIDLLERYYASESPEIKPYRRRNVVTLLNNWTADCDVARRKLAGSSSLSSSSSAGPSPIGDFTIY